MENKPDINAVIAYKQLCEEYMANQPKRFEFYERIARESGNSGTLKIVLARKGESNNGRHLG